jgi:hypothetical protein
MGDLWQAQARLVAVMNDADEFGGEHARYPGVVSRPRNLRSFRGRLNALSALAVAV